MGKKITTEDWIKKASKVHNNKYDYSKTIYTNAREKVHIICPEHGEFFQTPDAHARGQGCQACGGNKPLTREVWIERAKIVHGDRYDYSKVEYVNYDKKVCIICPIHGEFWQTGNSHLKGFNCPKCYGRNRTTDEWIEKAKQIHGDKYDYSKSEYIVLQERVCIICPIHGKFWQTPANHLRKRGCPKCIGKNKTTEELIEEMREIHGDKYDYSKVEYTSAITKVCIICYKHGEFQQTPNKHLGGKGCPKCVGKNKTTEEWIKEVKQVHGNRYDYSKVKYIDSIKKVCIICSEHGEFWQTPLNHFNSNGCAKCVGKNKTTDEWIKQVKQVHNNRYDYSKSIYTNAKEKVCIICPEHGEFYQIAFSHSNGSKCPKCISSKMEDSVSEFLNKHSILYEKKYRGFAWLKYKQRLELDFYIPSYNIGIECQGQQHFISINYFGGQDGFEKTKIRDKIKKRLCEKHNIPLFYINYNDNIEDKLNTLFFKSKHIKIDNTYL